MGSKKNKKLIDPETDWQEVYDLMLNNYVGDK